MKTLNIFLIAILIVNLVLASPVKSKGKNNGDLNQYEIDHVNTLDNYLSECTLLLRRNSDFPLKKSEKKIQLFGNGVRKTIKGGTGSGDVNSRSFDNIEQAFVKGGYKVLSTKFLDQYDALYEKAQTEFYEEVQRKSNGNFMAFFGATMPEPEFDIPYEKKGDVAVYVLSRNSGEGADRKVIKGDVYLTDSERKMILTLAKGYKKFMLVLNTGGPVDLSGLESVKNILVLSQLGVNTSKTLVDVISGAKYPSGKLATTWTKFEDYPTIGEFGEQDDTNYKEGVYVGYRYFDTENVDVMFPFGFGLGYTDFDFEVKSARLVGEKFEVKTTVKNVGKFKGKEVMELYLSKPSNKLDEPYQILVGYGKTKELKPNQRGNVKISFNLSDFASYDEKSQSYILDKGSYVVRVGNSSRNTKACGEIKIKSRITVRKVKNSLGKPGFKDYVPVHKRKHEDLSKVAKFTLDAKSIKKETVKYNQKQEISKKVKALSNEQKARLVIGNYKDGDQSIVGNAGTTVVGAAGETAQVAGLKPVVMADGPAGLRLSKDYFIDEKGEAHAMGSSLLPKAVIEMLPEEVRGYFEGAQPGENDKIYHQYTTAIPIGTAIAQSWNREFARICGDIVGNEMEIFKVDLWLAPALNIHRSILCGRNFEYYSEDPFISGTIAAAITTGVQKHKSKLVTIKHYAANNQETNRYLNSSNVSERAMREIYLKGFEICVKESQPGAVMTSYNLINGIHTSESKGLTNDILRTEFGFKGIVMTDWVMNMEATKYPNPQAYKVVKATGDIFMPGTVADYNNVLEALKNKTLSMEELELSASRIYNLSKKLKN